jgi:hypothetical protein
MSRGDDYERLCACLTEAVKTTIVKLRFERFIDHLAERSREGLIEEGLSSLNPPQHGLGVTGKSSRPR